MWTCPVCHEEHEDQFKDCWKCAGKEHLPQPAWPLRCLRCEVPLVPMGSRFVKLETGGALASVLTDFTQVHEQFDLYACQQCGKVEFYLPSIGRDQRPPVDEPTP